MMDNKIHANWGEPGTAKGIERLGMGLAALGRPGYINLGHAEDLQGQTDPEDMQNHVFGVLDAAFDAGIRYYDCARSYGRAEEFVAAWLSARGIDPEHVIVASKWGYRYTADWKVEAVQHEIKEHSPAMLDAQWEESREHLGKYLKLYQIHSATSESGVLRNADVLDRLFYLKEQGLKIGLSVSGAEQAQTILDALEVRREGHRLFDAVQATFNMLEPSAGAALRQAHEAGLRVIVKEALANGRLTTRNRAPHDSHLIRLLGEKALQYRATPDVVALAWVLREPWVSTALLGATTADQLQSNLGCLRFEAADWHGFADELRESAESYWATRSRLKWN